MKKIVTTGLELTRRDPIEVFFLCSIIGTSVEKREKSDRMPSERLNIARRNFLLPIVISDRFAEKLPAVGSTKRFKGIGIESMAADSGKDGVKQVLGEDVRLLGVLYAGRLLQHQRAIYVRQR